MKKLIFVLFLMVFAVSVSANTGIQEKKTDKQEKQVKSESKIFNTVCPVSGEEIEGDYTVEHKGKTYAVCCKRCLKKFEKDPEKYIKNLSEDGKKFKKGND